MTFTLYYDFFSHILILLVIQLEKDQHHLAYQHEDLFLSFPLLTHPPPTFVAFSPCCLTFTLLLQYAMLILQSIPHSKKRTPFAFQNESFCPPKRILLQRKRTPFRERKESFWNYALLQGYNISIASAPLHASCRHHEGGVE